MEKIWRGARKKLQINLHMIRHPQIKAIKESLQTSKPSRKLKARVIMQAVRRRNWGHSTKRCKPRLETGDENAKAKLAFIGSHLGGIDEKTFLPSLFQ